MCLIVTKPEARAAEKSRVAPGLGSPNRETFLGGAAGGFRTNSKRCGDKSRFNHVRDEGVHESPPSEAGLATFLSSFHRFLISVLEILFSVCISCLVYISQIR